MVWRKDSVNRAAKKHGNDAQPVAPCCEHKHLQLADPLPRAARRLTFYFFFFHSLENCDISFELFEEFLEQTRKLSAKTLRKKCFHDQWTK